MELGPDTNKLLDEALQAGKSLHNLKEGMQHKLNTSSKFLNNTVDFLPSNRSTANDSYRAQQYTKASNLDKLTKGLVRGYIDPEKMDEAFKAIDENGLIADGVELSKAMDWQLDMYDAVTGVLCNKIKEVDNKVLMDNAVQTFFQESLPDLTKNSINWNLKERLGLLDIISLKRYC